MKVKFHLIIMFVLAALGRFESVAQVNAGVPEANPSQNTKVTDVWVVIKSHFDLGYTDLAGNVFQRYRMLFVKCV